MKIGIITFWQTENNYGQILQCFALQKYLKRQGHDTYLIRYTHYMSKPTLKEQAIKIFKIYPIIKKIIHLFKKKQQPSVTIDRGFSAFKNKYITSSPRLYRNLSELRNDPPQADCYITGSDQVWAQLLNKKNNEIFFLNFGNKNIRRISYAASFAMNKYPSHLTNKLKKELSRFTAISVREKSGINICRNIGYEAQLVLDPTFLINPIEYTNLINTLKNDIIKNTHFIFCYLINIQSQDEIKWNEIKTYAQSINCKIITTFASGLNDVTFKLDYTQEVYPTIEEWLSYIYHSQKVITSSFHGIALSIILNKDFIYIPLSGNFQESNNRVIDLLNQLSLLDRMLTPTTNIIHIAQNKINWQDVNYKLKISQEISRNFLLQTLKN